MKYNKIVFSSLLVLALSSCNKLIEITETDFVGGDIALKTVENNEQSIIGGYSASQLEMDILLNATFADEVKVGDFYNAGTTHEWQYTSTDVGIRDNFTAISHCYRVIDRVNRVLAAVATADSTRAGDNVLRSKLRGEALFLRAFSHFQVFRYYCANYNATGLAMPYMEAPSIAPQSRLTMGPYFQKLNADLVEAKGLVPDNLTNISRATKLAVSGLQARVALYMRDYPAAVTFSTEYINGLPLATAAQFPGIWTDANNTEVAWRLDRTNTVSPTVRMGSLFRGTGTPSPTITVGVVTWRPSDKIWDAYDKVNDVRFNAYFKDEPLLAPRITRMIYKYNGPVTGTTAYGSATENVANAKMFRTGEMYLIRAEARAEQGAFTGANSAESDINALRTARITGYTPVVFASKQAAIDAIVLERFKELAYEGHRFFDLRRWGLPVARLASDAPTTSAVTLPASDFRFLLPIPQVDILANRGSLEQNPGYN